MDEQAAYEDNPLASVILDIMLLMGKKVTSESFQNLIKLKVNDELRSRLINQQQIVYNKNSRLPVNKTGSLE